jgi:hypothetical protein
VESKSLNLWKQQLVTLPASLWEQTMLESLILADNGLAELPEAIGALTNLHTLDLGHNQLADLPESLGQLTGLSDYLYLHDNRLTALRESLFARLIRLRYLNVSHNRLTRLPDTIGNLWSLEEFRADNNQLDALPKSFEGLAAARAAPAQQPVSRAAGVAARPAAACVSRSAGQPVHHAAALDRGVAKPSKARPAMGEAVVDSAVDCRPRGARLPSSLVARAF